MLVVTLVMSNITDQVQAILHKNISQAVTAATSEIMALYQSVAATAFGASAVTQAAPPAPQPKAAAKKASKSKTEVKASGVKRSPEEMASTCESVLNYIKQNSGAGAEAIAKALGKKSSELVLPVKKLLADKKITRQGEKRATRYFPAKAG